MNRQVEVIQTTLRKTAHYLMINSRDLEAYIHFALMYTTDHIFMVLPIKDLINKDDESTMPFKLAIGMKPSVSHLRVFFLHVFYGKLLHTLKKGVKYASPSAKLFLQYLRRNYIALKWVSCVRIKYKGDNIFI